MPSSTTSGGEARLALGAGAFCYIAWGVIPLAFQLMGRMGVGAWEILASRTVWAIPAAALFVVLARQGEQVRRALGQPKVLGWLALSSLLIAFNWVVFIAAVNSGRVLETSLGYYINPLIVTACGAVFFREKIDRLGLGAIGLAAVGVVLQAVALGQVPFVSLALATSFAAYAVVRKRVAATAQTGLLIECLILGLPGAVYLLWLQAQGQGHLGASPALTAWLLACGPLTAVPLVLFACAARRLPLSAMAFMQFIAPTMTFVMGVAQGEPFTALRAASFAFIWGGAVVFAYGAWARSRAAAHAAQLELAAAE
jgi:chloramphenicol-sensitive protein RarD